MAFLVAVTNAIYSASTDKVAIVAYFCEDHDTNPFPISKMKPLVDCWLSRSWAQFELVYLTRSKLSFVFLPNTKLNSIVLLR